MVCGERRKRESLGVLRDCVKAIGSEKLPHQDDEGGDLDGSDSKPNIAESDKALTDSLHGEESRKEGCGYKLEYGECECSDTGKIEQAKANKTGVPICYEKREGDADTGDEAYDVVNNVKLCGCVH